MVSALDLLLGGAGRGSEGGGEFGRDRPLALVGAGLLVGSTRRDGGVLDLLPLCLLRLLGLLRLLLFGGLGHERGEHLRQHRVDRRRGLVVALVEPAADATHRCDGGRRHDRHRSGGRRRGHPAEGRGTDTELLGEARLELGALVGGRLGHDPLERLLHRLVVERHGHLDPEVRGEEATDAAAADAVRGHHAHPCAERGLRERDRLLERRCAEAHRVARVAAGVGAARAGRTFLLQLLLVLVHLLDGRVS